MLDGKELPEPEAEAGRGVAMADGEVRVLEDGLAASANWRAAALKWLLDHVKLLMAESTPGADAHDPPDANEGVRCHWMGLESQGLE